ncbi:MAG: hypothetical protein DMG65_05470 [Candidatus Angelobacter sp. Gp1-AA117]|nr:MAG: hypothetical protein DMG65_05470 [Candidatus Angelobacter sp. Gp1-AA117]
MWLSSNGGAHFDSVEITIVSDSMMLTSDNLIKLSKASAFLQAEALRVGVALRGCIAFGRHVTLSWGNSHLVLSDGLAKAYASERLAVYPRIVLHSGIMKAVEESMFVAEGEGLRIRRNVDLTLFLQSEDGQWFLNPYLESAYLRSIKLRLVGLLDQGKALAGSVREKYLWLSDPMNYWSIGPRQKIWMAELYDVNAKVFLEKMQSAYERLPDVASEVVPTWLHSNTFHRFFDLSLANTDTGRAALLIDEEVSPFRNTFQYNVDLFSYRRPSWGDGEL